MSPEQALSKPDLDARTDIYSLGVMFYELLVGKVPFDADTPFAIIHDHIYTPLPLPRMVNPQLSQGVERVLLKALAKNRADRFAEVSELVLALRDAVTGSNLPDALPSKSAGAPVPDTAPHSAETARRLPALPAEPVVQPLPVSRHGRVPAWPNSRWFWAAGIGLLGLLIVVGLLGVFTPPAASAPTAAPIRLVVATAVATLTPTQPATPTLPPTFTPAPTTPPQTQTAQVLVPPACTTIGQTWTSPVDGMILVCVPAGKFLMGAAAGDTSALSNERPQHEVSLDAFWIDRTEVTNRQFELFSRAENYLTDAEKAGSGVIYNGSVWIDMQGAFWKQPKGPGSDLKGRSEHPVVQVSLHDAVAYCWAGRRLPREAQWEMAARGSDGRLYPWGNAAPDANRVNFNLNVGDTTVVGKYPSGASPYGALDMAGNIGEWVSDWYSESYSSAAPVSNPTGPSSGQYGVLRGGSWNFGSSDVRASLRTRFLPEQRGYGNGFRCSR